MEVGWLSQYSCGLDGLGSIPWGVKIFLFFTAFRLSLRPTQPPVQWELGIKHPGYEVDNSPPSGTKAKIYGKINGKYARDRIHVDAKHVCKTPGNTSFGSYDGT
jgi:hypothetical protein